MTPNDALFHYLLRLGDNALILGHRFAEWCSRGPLLEEDLAMTNISLDLTGQAQLYLQYAAEVEGKGQSEDDLAYRRAERRFYNHLLTELPNGDFALSMTRLFLFSSYQRLLLEKLSAGSDERLAAIAAKAHKEVRYHLAHARDWMMRLGRGTAESHGKMQAALEKLWPFTGELFEMDAVDQMAMQQGFGMDLTSFQPDWLAEVQKTLADAGLKQPADSYMHTGSRQGIHTEHLGHLLSEMQYLVRAYPDANW